MVVVVVVVECCGGWGNSEGGVRAVGEVEQRPWWGRVIKARAIRTKMDGGMVRGGVSVVVGCCCV